jgi:large subunit ribosomal protein L29
MPQTKAKELKALSVDELDEKYNALKKELFQLRIQAKLQKLGDLSKIRKTRRLLARVLTVKQELEHEKPNG